MSPNPNVAIAAALYQPLKHEKADDAVQELRLLSVDSVPADPASGELISCTLQVCSVAAARRSGYFALSYVWGDAADTRPLLVNGLVFAATRNLVEALLHVCVAQPACRAGLWVDAVCINQEDVPEKNLQVAIMGRIYSGATETLAWLGAADPSSTTAMQLANQLWSDDDILTIGGKMPLFEKLGAPEYFDLFERLGAVSLIAAHVFAERAYWERIWTVQEVVLSNSCRLIAGTSSCFLHSLVDIMELAHSEPVETFLARDPRDYLPADIAAKTQKIQDILFNIQIATEQQLPIPLLYHLKKASFGMGVRGQFTDVDQTMSCVGYTSDRKATDPRDKLFGLAAMVDIGVEIDYDMSARELYAAFAERMITQLDDASSMLMWAGLSAEPSSLGLPSWVPDWSVSPIPMPVFGGKLHEFGLQGIQSVITGGNLRVRGMRLGTIASTDPLKLVTGTGVKERCRRISEQAEFLLGRDPKKIVDEILIQPPEAHVYKDDLPLLAAALELLLPSRLRDPQYPPSHNIASLIHCFTVSGAIPVAKAGEDDVATSNGRYLGRRVLFRVCEEGRSDVLDRDDILREAADSFRKTGFTNTLLLKGLDGRGSYAYFRTTEGRLGYAARGFRDGDAIYLIGSCADLVLLRPVGDHFVFLSLCCVLGLEGARIEEILQADGQSSLETLEIW